MSSPNSKIQRISEQGLGDISQQLQYATFGYLNCLKYYQIAVTDTEAVQLFDLMNPLPEGTVMAIIVIEGDATNTDDENQKCVRFIEDGETDPTASIGMPLGNLSVYECKNLTNINAFKIIGIPVGKTQLMNIQFYG